MDLFATEVGQFPDWLKGMLFIVFCIGGSRLLMSIFKS